MNRTCRSTSLLGLLLLALVGCQSALTPGVESGNPPPIASFDASPLSGPAPLPVVFDASTSRDDGAIVLYSWNFGDGASADGAIAEHSYDRPGTFTATLTVTDNLGATATASRTVTVLGPDGSPPAGPPDAPPGSPPPQSPDASLVAAGVLISTERERLERESSELGLEAVVAATQASGGGELTTTGTLTQDAGNPQSFNYSAEPGDRLRVVFADGSSLEYQFSALDGNFNAPTVDEFLRQPHGLAYRLLTSDGSDLAIALARDAGAYRNTMAGTLVSGGVAYSLDLEAVGSYFASAESNASEYQTEDRVQGAVSADGFSATVDESSSFRLVVVENGVEVSKRTIDNVWTVGADQYALSGGFIKRNFINGKPAEFDLWAAEGTLSRNGVVIGGIGGEQTAFTVDIFLLADGERTVLYSHQLQ